MTKKRPNIIDFLMILVVIALAVLAVYKFAYVNQKESHGVTADGQKITYTAVLDDVRKPTIDALHIGDTMYDEKSGKSIGVIADIQSAPKMKNVVGAQGNSLLVEYPNYYTVTVTLESEIIEKEDGYFASGSVELKGNSMMKVFTKYAQSNMRITAIDV